MTTREEPLEGIVTYAYFAEQLGMRINTIRIYATSTDRTRDFPQPLTTPPGTRTPLFDKTDADAFIAEYRKISRKRPRADTPDEPVRSVPRRRKRDLVGYQYIADGLGITLESVWALRTGTSKIDYFPEPDVTTPLVRSPLWLKHRADKFIARRTDELAALGDHPLAEYNRERRAEREAGVPSDKSDR